MNVTTAAVSLAVRRVTVGCKLGFPELPQPKLRTSHLPPGSAAVLMPGIAVTFRRSMVRRVSVWQLMQSVLKKKLLVGSAMVSRICLVWSAEGGGVAKTVNVATPLRCAIGRLVAETAAFLQVMGLRLLVCGSGTTRGLTFAAFNICANCRLPSRVGPCAGPKWPA